MINEEQKYTAELLKIAGFAMMTPLGKLVIDIYSLTTEKINGWFIAHIIIGAILFYFGIIVALRELYIIKKR